jgi:hypothetical protein
VIKDNDHLICKNISSTQQHVPVQIRLQIEVFPHRHHLVDDIRPLLPVEEVYMHHHPHVYAILPGELLHAEV